MCIRDRAWFTDTEKVNANFTAGVLDISVKPGETDKGDLTFENLRPMLYDNFYKELEPNGNEKWVNDVTPVSYTHLDVYKRQGCILWECGANIFSTASR